MNPINTPGRRLDDEKWVNPLYATISIIGRGLEGDQWKNVAVFSLPHTGDEIIINGLCLEVTRVVHDLGDYMHRVALYVRRARRQR